MSGVLNALLGSYAARAGAFESIASTVLGSNTTTVTFNSIPGTYQHLQLRILVRDSQSEGTPNLSYGLRLNNNSTTTNYITHTLDGSGLSAFGEVRTGLGQMRLDYLPANGITSGIFGVGIIDIHDYASTTKNTTVRAFIGVDNNGGGGLSLRSGGFFQTSAITRIDFITVGGTSFLTGSTFALYGIKAAA